MTLWRMPIKGDVVRSKITGSLVTVTKPWSSWNNTYKDDWEFVTVTPIEPPPEPMRRTVYIPVYKKEPEAGGPVTLFAASPVLDARVGKFATTGKRAMECTSGFSHRVGIIKVELVEGQYDE